MYQQHQNHLRTLRRGVNRAVTDLKEGKSLTVHTGWAHGRAFGSAQVTEAVVKNTSPDEPLFYLYPTPEESAAPSWHSGDSYLPEGLKDVADFFWPGPLILSVKCVEIRRAIHLACPWHPLIRELLSRHGACLWTPLSDESEHNLAGLRQHGREIEAFEGERALIWPDFEVCLKPTRFDASTRPWRWMEAGFIDHDELAPRIPEPFILSADRAFPQRQLRSFVPANTTVVLEAEDKSELAGLVEQFRQGIGPEWSLRIYLDEGVAHAHFPEDRVVRVYGEMSDPERVRRRLEAMLERQRRRSGKRILLIGVAELPPAADSFKLDLQKLADHWITVPAGGELELDEFFT